MRIASFLAAGKPAMPEPFRQLTVMEPELIKLWDECLYIRRNWDRSPSWQEWDRLAAWYGYPSSPFIGIKPRMSLLVGWGRPDRDDILGSRQAYDCAYRSLLDAMGG